MYNSYPRRHTRVSLILFVLGTLVLVQLSGAAALGQSGSTGTLSGVVQDPNGAALPGVAIVLKNLGTGATHRKHK